MPPVVDLGRIGTGAAELPALAREIGRACRDTGFFYLAHPPLAAGLREAVFEASARFFAAEPSVKQAVSIGRSRHNRGYVGVAVEALDPDRPPDLKEAYNVGLDLVPDDPDVLAGRPFRGPNLWPNLDGFRATVLAYYEAMWALGRLVHRAVALDLGLPAAWFEPHLDRPLATLRLLHYPAAPASTAPGQLGAGRHTDYGNLTLLATDGVGGLQVQTRDGTWIGAPVIPGALVCNIGDCLMRWTNDVYVSTPHRVVSPPGRERFSVAFFLDPNPDSVVACLPTCHGPDRPVRHAPVTAAAYLASRLDATYTHRRPGMD